VTPKELRLIEASIRDDLASIGRLLAELGDRGILGTAGEARAGSRYSHDQFMLRAVASVLHDFYGVVENICELIAREYDEHLPSGPDWHLRLLRQMTLDVPGVRMAVISKDTMLLLDKYRSFRHVFRNVYGFNLDASRLEDLIGGLPDAARRFHQEMLAFLGQLRDLVE
jgi:hypothetical protein